MKANIGHDISLKNSLEILQHKQSNGYYYASFQLRFVLYFQFLLWKTAPCIFVFYDSLSIT